MGKKIIQQLIGNNKVFYFLNKGVDFFKKNGLKATLKKTNRVICSFWRLKQLAKMPSKQELDVQRKTAFSKNIKISIVVPLFNTPTKFLNEMIDSVVNQTYSNWELCMADGSDEQHGIVGKICREYANRDERIKYRKLERNMGISGNTNACLEMTSGEYIGLFDHDDFLHPSALFYAVQAICEKGADFIFTDEAIFRHRPEDTHQFHFKPDYAPDTLRSYNYICHFTVFKADMLGGDTMFHSECDGAQDYDLFLRLTEQAKRIVHIPRVLYFWRSHTASTAAGVGAKPYVTEAAHLALHNHLERLGLDGTVLDSEIEAAYRISYHIKDEPLVSILIPNKDHVSDLDLCIQSIRTKSTYSNWEILIIENNSTDPETFAYYERIQAADSRIRLVTWDGPFNFSAINNYGAKFACGSHILLLNNDVEIISEDWLEQMVMFSQRKDVGAVGAKLYYPDGSIQHGGVIIGIANLAGHSHKCIAGTESGYMGRLKLIQNYSAVTGACLMVRKDVWNQINGLDESFVVAMNDVDFCLRIRKAGYLIVWTPYAELYHYESKSRGYEDTPEKKARFEGEVNRFRARWADILKAGDPYYNANLTLEREDFSAK